MVPRLASTCPFTETTHGDCVFAFPKHISLISLQGKEDFSASLEMTIRQERSSTFSLLPSLVNPLNLTAYFPRHEEVGEMRIPLRIPKHPFSETNE